MRAPRTLNDVNSSKRKRSANPTVITQTARLELREFQKADWADVHEYASDPIVTRFMGWGPNSEEETSMFIQKSIAQKNERPRMNYSLAVVTREGNRLIGGCGIYESNVKNREGWIGYCLNHQLWGQGYATEAALALVDFGFTHLNFHRIFATCDPANTASAHVMEKIGMRYEGHLKENIQHNGEWLDSLLYAILDREWKTSK